MKRTSIIIAMIALVAACKPKANDYIEAGRYFRAQDSIKQYRMDSIYQEDIRQMYRDDADAWKMQAYEDSIAYYKCMKK